MAPSFVPVHPGAQKELSVVELPLYGVPGRSNSPDLTLVEHRSVTHLLTDNTLQRPMSPEVSLTSRPGPSSTRGCIGMKRTVLLLASVAVALLVASVATLVVPKERAKAAFPGKNAKIAFQSDRAGTFEIYTMSPTGGNLTRLTHYPESDKTAAVVCCGGPHGWPLPVFRVAI
jgi:hypothetical protein